MASRATGSLPLSTACLLYTSQAKVEDFSATLLDYIREQGGRIAWNDKSPAEEIYATFGVSKKTFKKAVGDLYKKHLVVLEEDGIRIRY